MLVTRRVTGALLIAIMFISMLYSPIFEVLNPISDAEAVDIGFESDGRVNDDPGTAEQSGVAMAYYNNEIYLVWEDRRNGDFDIFFSKSTDGGATWGDGLSNNNDIRVDDTDRNLNNSDNASEQLYPDITVDNSGNIYVVWQDDREGRGDDDIYFAKSTDGGASFTDSVRVDHNGSGGFDQSSPCIAVDNAGNIYVAWEDERNLLNDFDIYFTNSSDGGASFSGPDILVDDDIGTSLQQNPQLVVKETGGVPELYMVWQDERLGTTNFEVMFSKSADGGQTWGDGFDNNNDKIVNDDTTFVQEHPQMVLAGNGDIVVVWDDERGGSWKNLYMSRSSDGGDTWSTNKKLYDSQSNTTDQIHPVIAVSGNNMVVAWLDNRNGVAQTDIYFAMSGDNGATFGQFFRADQAPADTIQSDPVIYMKDSQTIYLAWEDNRNTSHGRDIFFSKSGVIVLIAPTLSTQAFTPPTGSSTQEFHFTVVYTDVDEDPPAAGYPKLHMFTDINGTEPYPGSPFEMFKQLSPAQDSLFKNGMIYEKRLTLSDEYNYTYFIQAKAETGNLSLVRTDLTKGPVIDRSNVTFSDAFPSETEWQDHKFIKFGISIQDVGPAGIDVLSVKYRMSTTGLSGFSDWAISSSFEYNWSGDVLRVSLSRLLDDGVNNYVQWQAADKFGNGPKESEIYNIRIDTGDVEFSEPIPDPAKNYWFNKELVEVGISVSDTGAGVNGSTIEYAYSTSGTDNYGSWTSAGLSGISGKFVARTNITFGNSSNNFVKWRAYDALGNGPKESDDHRIRVDTTLGQSGENHPPTAPSNIKPASTSDRTPFITWDESTDEDGDDISYWISIGTSVNATDFLAWTTTGSKLGHMIAKNMNEGTYYVHVKAYDGHDYSEVTIAELTISSGGNTPPTPPTSLTPLFTSERRPSFSWSGAADADGDDLMYTIQIGTSSGASDILELQYLGFKSSYEYMGTPLAHGKYIVTIMAYDGFDYSEPAEFEVKIAYYELAVVAESPVSVKKGETKSSVFNITNNGNSNDIITLNFSSALAGNANLSFSKNNFMLVPEGTASVELIISASKDAEPNDYYLKLTATSEDGVASAEITIIVTITDPSVGPGPNGGGQDGDGDDDEELGYPWLPNFMKGMFFWFVIILIIVIIGVAVAASRRSKRKRDEEESEAARRRDRYDDVYGEQRPPAPPPAPPQEQYYDEYASAPPQQYPEEYYQEQPAEYYQEQPPPPPPPIMPDETMEEEEAVVETPETAEQPPVDDIEHPDTEVVPPLVEKGSSEADDGIFLPGDDETDTDGEIKAEEDEEAE